MLKGPEYRGRTPEQIISVSLYFDSVGYTYRALSWLDLAKRERKVCALQYAALETRMAIEQLLFEEIILCVGTELDIKYYQMCKGNSTRLYKIINKLNPDYQKLANFTQAITSVDNNLPPIIVWDHKKLINYWGNISEYIHWAGEPSETIESQDWFDRGISVVESGANYIWKKNEAGFTGIMMPQKMQPEIRVYWERFCVGDIDLNSVRQMAIITLPILQKRLIYNGNSEKGDR